VDVHTDMNQPINGKHLIRVNTPRVMAGGAVSVTVEVQDSTTVGDVKRKVLKRFKPGLIDPNLFTITVLVEADNNTHSCFVLRDDEYLLRLQHLWRHGPATYTLDPGDPIFVRIHMSNVYPNTGMECRQEYKTIAIAEETKSLEALRILFQNKRRVPEDYILVRQDLRDFGEYAIKHSERLSNYCKGPYGKILLKKLKKRLSDGNHVQWNDEKLTSFIDYDSPDEGLDDGSSELGSSDSSSLWEFFSWMSDAVTV